MDNDTSKLFVSGLKSVIKRSWASQEEFAAGVTSKVNLSNVLRGTSGTSLAMRKSLAEKAGMTIEELIEIGKGTIRTRATDEVAVRNSTPYSPVLPFNTQTSSSELFAMVGDYVTDINDQIMSHAKGVSNTVKALVAERNRLLDQQHQDQVIINSIDEAIKVVSHEFKIVYCNRAYSEKFHQGEGESCASTGCKVCNGECLAQRVFNSGHLEKALTNHNGVWLYRTAYPMLSHTGKVTKVVIIYRYIDPLLDLLVANGWTAPATMEV